MEIKNKEKITMEEKELKKERIEEKKKIPNVTNVPNVPDNEGKGISKPLSLIPNNPNVPNVPDNEEDKKDKKDKGQEVTGMFGSGIIERIIELFYHQTPLSFFQISQKTEIEYESIKRTMLRNNHLFQEAPKQGKIKFFRLSPEGENFMQEKLKYHKKKQEYIVKSVKEEEERLKDLEELRKEAKMVIENIELKREGSSVYINFKKIAELSHVLASKLLDNPDEIIEIFKSSFETDYNIIFKNLPKTSLICIEEIRQEHLNKLIMIEARSVSLSSVRPVIKEIKFDCPSCGSVISIRQDLNIQPPSRCSCGRKGKFKIISRELVNSSNVMLEDLQEKTENPNLQRIKGIIQEDLTKPKSIITFIPGNEIKIVGVVREIPIFIKGKQSTTLNFIFEILYAELFEPEIDISNFSEKDVQKIIDLAATINEKGLSEMNSSFAPDIYGYEQVKNALILQLCNKKNNPSKQIRNKPNILLIGDPGCINGDSYIILRDGTFQKIKDFNIKKQRVMLNKRFGNDKDEAKANKFWHYKNYPTKKIITETGKELICSYNHPLWIKRKVNEKTKRDWIKAEDIKIGDKIKVMIKIRCKKKRYEKFDNFKISKNSKRINIPECNEEVALFIGIITGDGWTNKYKVNLCCAEKDKEIMERAIKIAKNEFNLNYWVRENKLTKRMIDKREIFPKEKVFQIEWNSKVLSDIMKMPKSKYKRVPKIIMKSKDSVISNFLKGLFSTDGCCFVSKTKDRKDKIFIQLKSASHKLLLDVQLLLIRFGIQARVKNDSLYIKRFEDVGIFKREIGFVLKMKNKILSNIENLKIKGRGKLTYEKIINVREDEIQDVYDLTIPKYHKFISNGIISHNTAKSILGNFSIDITPGSRKAVGGGSSAVGITASVIKEEESLGGYRIEPGALILSKELLMLDELNNLSDEDKPKLQEGMSEQSVSINKANLHIRLRVTAGILAAANPKHGTFKHNEEIISQFNIPSPIINRFDEIFIMQDNVEENRDREIAKRMIERERENINPKYSKEFLRKFFVYIRNFQEPEIDETLSKNLQKIYITIRKDKTENLIINPRFMETLTRLIKASAKIRLSKYIEGKDIKRALEILRESHFQISQYKLFDFGKKETIEKMINPNPNSDNIPAQLQDDRLEDEEKKLNEN